MTAEAMVAGAANEEAELDGKTFDCSYTWYAWTLQYGWICLAVDGV